MASLMALTALSIDIMLPALPQIQADFDTGGENNQQLVVTLYVLGFAAGQLFYGPLSDRFGRKSVLLFGLALYAVASVLCFVAWDFELLLAARFLQGIANASPRVVAIAVVRDVYGGLRMAEVMSFVMMVFILVPVIAPTIGGGFLLFGSWHLIFGFLAVVSLLVLVWTTLRLPETRRVEDRESLSVAWLVKSFAHTITTGQTLGYTLATGAVFGGLMGYINSAQQIFADVYDVHAWFPVIFGCVAAALAVAAFVNSRLVIALIAICLFFFGLIMPNFNSLAMEPMGRIAGTASSFIGAVTTGIAATLGWYVGQLYDGTIVPLLAGFAAFGVLCLVLVLITEKGRLFQTTQ